MLSVDAVKYGNLFHGNSGATLLECPVRSSLSRMDLLTSV